MMNWSNIKLILHREVRDQLRDRRTLFMIFVLPLLLYPLLGTSLFQVAQFVREQPTRVEIFGVSELPDSPPLVEGSHFAERLFTDPEKVRLLDVHIADDDSEDSQKLDDRAKEARQAVEQGTYEAVVYFPAGFAGRLEAFREALRKAVAKQGQSAKASDAEELKVPSPEIYYNTAKEKSQLAYIRVSQVLNRWTDEIGRQNLASSYLPESAVKPFDVAEHDVADRDHRDAAMWSKILPFLLLIWSLTGAFYPAIDLCAGEKERGTLETLLSSPAERSELVWGKLLTIMLFSVATAVLNILSIGVTGSIVMTQIPGLGPPPMLAPVWLLIALFPVSALFSALCLALAAFARSTKEGQYYLMPLVLVTMPLVILPMSPGVELNLGNSLIPITGVVLLLRSMLQGNYLEALPYIAPVMAVTIACCLLAIRWAIDQFNSESVLFRESERLDFGLWIKHLMRDREETPSVAAAIFCGVLILMVRFFMGLAVPQPKSFHDLAVTSLVTQLTVIATPALLMTIMLTRSPTKTLLLKMPPLASIPAAALLAVLVHPAVRELNILVQNLYPVSDEMQKLMAGLFNESPQLWQLVIVLAFVPAVFEELAFRGFILSGFRHVGHKWQAIALSSFFFGIAHGLFQQSIVACLVGMLIGYIAVQTGSLLPGIIYHVVHNSLALVTPKNLSDSLVDFPAADGLLTRANESLLPFFNDHPTLVLLGASSLAIALLAWFHRLPYAKSAEESLQEALNHQSAQAAAS
jgi:sodium transport system permease protein